MKAKSDSLTRYVFPFGIGLFVFSLLVALSVGPAGSYETSLYSAYPAVFWVSLGLGYCLGIFILLGGSGSTASTMLRQGMLLLSINNALLLLLPMLREYVYLGPFGPAEHVGYTLTILSTGHILGASAPADPYPASHIVFGMLSMLTTIPVATLTLMVPTLYFLLYTVTLAALAVRLKLRNSLGLVLALGCIPVYNIIFDTPSIAYYIPRLMIFSLMPLILILLVRSMSLRNDADKLVLVLIGLATALYHPFDSILVAFFIIFGALSILVYNSNSFRRVLRLESHTLSKGPNGWAFFVYLAVIFVVANFLWYGLQQGSAGGVRSLFAFLSNPVANASGYSVLAGSASRLGFSLYQDLVFAFNRTGDQWPYFVLGISGFIYGLSHPRNNKFAANKLLFSLFFAFCFLIAGATLLSGIGAVVAGSVRTELYLILFSILVFGMAMEEKLGALSQTGGVKVATVFTILLVFPLSLGIANTYGWPFNSWMNLQVTRSDMSGTGWFVNHENPTFALWFSYFDFFGMVSSVTGFVTIPANVPANPTLPDHFDTEACPGRVGDCNTMTTYLVSNSMARQWAQTVYPSNSQNWQWSQVDYNKLENDVTVELAYSNGGFMIQEIVPPQG